MKSRDNYERYKKVIDELKANPSLEALYKFTISNGNNEVAFRYKHNGKWESFSFNELDEMVKKYHTFFKGALSEIPSHSYIGFKASNSPYWVAAFYAILRSNHIPLLINPNEDKDNVINLLIESGAKALISDKNEENIGVLLVKMPQHLKNIPLSNEEKWEDKVALATSGTTQNSRIFVYKSSNIIQQLDNLYQVPLVNPNFITIEQGKKMRVLALLPFSHIFGFFTSVIVYLAVKSTLVFLPSLKPNDISSTCKKERITHIYAVPLFYNTLAKSIEDEIKREKKEELFNKLLDYRSGLISKYEAGFASTNLFQSILKSKILGKDLILCVAGGSVLSKKTAHILYSVGYPIYNGYGMTEVGITSVNLSKEYEDLMNLSVGKPLKEIDYKISDGELLIKSEQIYSYSIKNGEEIPTSLDKDGYFHTEDSATKFDDGSYFINGKLSNVYIADNGENVYLEEIESKFETIENINQLVCTVYKNLLTLIIQVSASLNKDGVKKLEQDVSDVNLKLPPFKQVKQIFVTTNPLPINASLKIKRNQIESILTANPEYFIKIDRNSSFDFSSFNKDEVDEIKEYLLEIFSSVLRLEKDKIGSAMHFVIDLNGDSFSYMSLFANVQADYPCVTDSEIGKLNTIDEFAYFILKNKN